MNEAMFLIFQLAVLLFSVMIHEVSHGLVALKLGDPTAKNAGRLNLNPLKHLDLFGSVILPLLLFTLSGGRFIFGWAKPVPYNPLNLKNPKKGSGIIAAVGPISNLLVAVVFGIILRLIFPFASTELVGNLIVLLNTIVLVNCLLAIFNLLPIPPLDGSGILFSLLPAEWREVQLFLTRYGLFILILFIAFGFGFISPIIAGLYKLIAGPAALL